MRRPDPDRGDLTPDPFPFGKGDQKKAASRWTGLPKAPAKASALIIAGGKGTRFWPASRENRPKPLFSIDEGTTLLSETIGRLQPLISRDRIFVLVTAVAEKSLRLGDRGV